MKIAFHEIKNYEEINETTIYHVFDLESNVDRKYLHDLIDDQLNVIGIAEEEKQGPEAYDEVYDEAQILHEAVSNKDLSNLDLDYFDFDIVEKTLDEALFEAGFNVMKSSASSSIYVKIGKREVRISDHERPSYDSGNGVMEKHQYDLEIISKDRLIKKEDLASVGIELDRDYFLA